MQIRYLSVFIFILFVGLKAHAHEWEDIRYNGFEELLPKIQQLYVLSSTIDPKVDVDISSPDEITLEVLLDYSKLIEFALGRNASYRSPQKGYEYVQIQNVQKFKSFTREFPDNITIFYPEAKSQNLEYSEYSKCGLECQKLLLENYVKSVTLVTKQRTYKSLDKKTKPPHNTVIDDNSSTLTDIATRYFKAPCDSESVIDKKRNPFNLSLRSDVPIVVIQLFDLCVAAESVEVPKHGFFYNEASPLWRDELSPKSQDRAIFRDLSNIEVKRMRASHWAKTSFGQPFSIIRYEEACMEVSPALPDAAIKMLESQMRENSEQYFADFPQGHRSPKGQYNINLKTEPPVSTLSYSSSKRTLYHKHISTKSGAFCYMPKFASHTSGIANMFFPPSSGDIRKLDFENAFTTNEIVEKLKSYDFLESSESKNIHRAQQRREIFLGTLKYLSQNYSNYYQEIFPAILPRLFDTSSNGLNQSDGYSLANHFFKTKPPAGSLSEYIKDVEAIYERRLKSVGCDGWKCPEDVINKGRLNAYHNITAALGPEGVPILEKIENTGISNTKALELCMGALTPKTKEIYFSKFQKELNTTPTSIDYDNVKALLMTDHADYIIEVLNHRLSHLKSIAAKQDKRIHEVNANTVRFLYYGVPGDFLKKPAGKRFKEILLIEERFNEHKTNRRWCEYRKVSGWYD